MGEIVERPAPPADAFAYADEDADAARQWLSAELEAQRLRGEPVALTAEQQERIRDVLTMDWWKAAMTDEEDVDEDPAQVLDELLPRRCVPRRPSPSAASFSRCTCAIS
ncbi:hypothetical protein [Microbacterium sp. NIBRBAC000506063]|uniref:hypothetical protein n=1 Tax=Microbacterium sp. NIBRBAC000506063 TaxID=2734618 RepID=UPI001BB7416E|nr:hypothetical protein [Microbacterium sp. NIBRBAC000506063]QTV79655.1 hypothetical protein KAE78_12700 [Microbacterium sp. NIBRBAC000506063]